jgi:TM2 domain-containing membrane protein YozV
LWKESTNECAAASAASSDCALLRVDRNNNGVKEFGIAALLALIFGLSFLYGIGHIYVGRIGRGIILLAAGVILGILVYVSVAVSVLTFGAGFIVTIFLLLVALVVNIWQTYNAYRLAKGFNAHVQQYGKPPW